MESPNLHKLNEERNVLRKLDKSGELPSQIEKDYLKSVEEKHKDFRINKYENFSDAKKELRYQKERFESGLVIDWEAIQKELGVDDYNRLDDLEIKEKSQKTLLLQRAKRLREMTNSPRNAELYKSLMKVILDSVEKIQKLFNHSTPGITLRYIGITQEDLDTVYLNLNL